MPKLKVSDVELYYEETGSGFPVIFCQEYAGDYRSWEQQVRHFARRYRVIRYNYRGYRPSDIPGDLEAYSQDILVSDMRALMERLSVKQAHLVGLATGGGVALSFAMAHPEMTKSVITAGTGAGTFNREPWLVGIQEMTDAIAKGGAESLADNIIAAPQRQPLRIKDPRAWDEFIAVIRDLSPEGLVLSAKVLKTRKPVTELRDQIAALAMPIMVMVGDRDTPALEPSLFVYRNARHAGLAVLPFTGHTLPIEEPALFNRLADQFLAAVDSGRWGTWKAAG